MANRLYRDAVDFRGNDHDRVAFGIFCDRSGCLIKVKCISSCRNCNGKGGTRFGVPIPVGQIKADNKVMLGFFIIRAGVDRYVITLVVNCIMQFSAGNCAKSPEIVPAVVLYKFKTAGAADVKDILIAFILKSDFINSGRHLFHGDRIGDIPVVQTFSTSSNANRKSSIGIAAATLRQCGDGQQGEE